MCPNISPIKLERSRSTCSSRASKRAVREVSNTLPAARLEKLLSLQKREAHKIIANETPQRGINISENVLPKLSPEEIIDALPHPARDVTEERNQENYAPRIEIDAPPTDDERYYWTRLTDYNVFASEKDARQKQVSNKKSQDVLRRSLDEQIEDLERRKRMEVQSDICYDSASRIAFDNWRQKEERQQQEARNAVMEEKKFRDKHRELQQFQEQGDRLKNNREHSEFLQQCVDELAAEKEKNDAKQERTRLEMQAFYQQSIDNRRRQREVEAAERLLEAEKAKEYERKMQEIDARKRADVEKREQEKARLENLQSQQLRRIADARSDNY